MSTPLGTSTAATQCTCSFTATGLTILSKDTDFGFATEFNNKGCQDIGPFNGQLLHVVLSGSKEFSVALSQATECTESPVLATWDIVNAADYFTDGKHLYIPLANFNINKEYVMAVSFRAFRDPNTPTTFNLVEIIELPLDGIPGFPIPEKKATEPLYFHCTKKNSIGFGIDEGRPDLARELMRILDEENIKVTFFVLGSQLNDPGTTKFYIDAKNKGHQV